MAELHEDRELADIDRLAMRYTGEAYKTRDSARVSAWVDVQRWHGWDASGTRKVTHAAPGRNPRRNTVTAGSSAEGTTSRARSESSEDSSG